VGQQQIVRNMFHFMNFMNRLYGPNMESIHPRIAKLFAKEKCDSLMDASMQMQRHKVMKLFYFMNRLHGPNMKLIHSRIAKLWAK
jgi:hypothetical protein